MSDAVIQQLSQSPNGKQRSFVSVASKIATGAVGSAGILLASQLLYVSLTAPEVRAPGESVNDSFREDGRLVEAEQDECDSNKEELHNPSKPVKNDGEIRVVFIGDSTVEGLGSETEGGTMAGRTASAMANSFSKSVRYWTIGKSGMTTAEVEKENVPLLHKVSQKYRVDLVVVSCGTNNLLWGQPVKVFEKEFDTLLNSIEYCRLGSNVPIMVVGFFNLSTIPLLPFPLSSVLGLRSKAFHSRMEHVIERRSAHRTMAVVNWPHIERLKNCIDEPMLRNLSRDKKKELKVKDFFADDGFHPARFGTMIMGNQLCQSFKEINRVEQGNRDVVAFRNKLLKSNTETTDEESRDEASA